MRPPRPPLDGLQRCLCPRLNSQFLNQIAFPNALTTAAALRHVTTTTTTTAARIPANERKPKSYRNDTGIQAPDGAEKPVPKPLDAKARHSRALARISAHLRAVPRNPPASVVSLLTDMAVRKEVALTLNLYEAIIPLANIETALVLLEDMKRRRISPSSRVYHSILRLLNNVWKGEQQRKAVLDEMKERWITLLPEGEEAVLIGRIRDRETRLVNEMLEEWRKRGKNPTALVWRVQVKQLLSAGRLSEAAELFRRAVAQADEHDTGVKIWDIWRERREGEYWKRNIYDLLRLAAEERNVSSYSLAFFFFFLFSFCLHPPGFPVI